MLDMVLTIIDDLNQTNTRYAHMTSRKRPKPFISAYKNRDLNRGGPDDDKSEQEAKMQEIKK